MNWGSPTYIFIWLFAYLLITAWIAWRYSTGIETEEDYYVAGRSVGPFANTMTIVATIMSGGIYLGTVGFFYQHGVNFLGYGFGFAGMVFALWFVGKRLWPVGKKFSYSTPQDFYGDLYQSEFLRLFGAVGSIIFLLPYFASNAVAMGTILETFAGLPYTWGVLLLLVFTTAYTLYGGMRAVIYTDVFQGVVSLLFGVVAVVTVLYAAGGYSTLMDTLPPKMTVHASDAVAYGLFIGWFLFMFSHPLVLSDRMTRMYTIRSLGAFRRNVLLTGGALLLMTTTFVLLGMASYKVAGSGKPLDQAILITIQQTAPWLMAWMVVVVWACGMSTLDSGLVGANAMLSKDIIRRYIKRDVSQQQLIRIGRWAMAVFGLLSIWIALVRPPYVWELIKLVNMYHMQFLPVLIGGLYWKRASKLGAELGWAAGVLIGIYYTFISTTPPPINVGGAPGPGVFALLVNVVLFVVISLLVSPIPASHRATFEEAWSPKERLTTAVPR
jgi:SSS family solute:Na+ symporter